MNEGLIKYLSGLSDADANLSFMFSGLKSDPGASYVGLMYSLSASDNVDRHGFVKNLHKMTGMGNVYQCGKHQQMHTWTITKKSDLEKLLPRLTKHMCVKARHWQFLLDTRRGYQGKTVRLEEADRLRDLCRKSRAENVGPLKPKNHPTWGWAAGFLDGNGHFYRRARANGAIEMYVGATVHENDAAILAWLQQTFGGYVYPHSKNAKAKRWRRNLGVSEASFALRFLPKLANHSRLKRHKIDQIIHTHSQRLIDQRATA